MKMRLHQLSVLITVLVATSAEIPQNTNNNNENSQYQKPYVRTFLKYHHRRNSPQTSDYDATDTNEAPRTKRSLPNEIDYEVGTPDSNSNQVGSEWNSITGNTSRNNTTFKSLKDNMLVQKDVKEFKHKVKAAIPPILSEPKPPEGPRRYCVHRSSQIAYAEDTQFAATLPPDYEEGMAESDYLKAPGTVNETVLPDGSRGLAEECWDSLTSCYTFWLQQDNDSIVILGQGCWHTSGGGSRCGDSTCTKGPARLPGAHFCCCTGDYCNMHFGLSPEVEVARATAASSSEYAGDSWWRTALLLAASALVLGALALYMLCRRSRAAAAAAPHIFDKGDTMGTGPDSLATGLLCVDNLTLTKHIGQGKFGSVWRGSLGATPVAVKIYSSAESWEREVSMYGTPQLQHPNILRYYGSDCRPTLTEGSGRRLVVLELCEMTLRQRLKMAPLSWQQLAHFAHGLASALAHLHTATGNKPSIVHRDVNSNNVLVASGGGARLADLGLAQALQPQRAEPKQQRITEAGTLRYLAPEALEGALDLVGARAALCAVDVFALGLVLWEMLWRCSGAHNGPTPPYAPPYAHMLPATPTLHQMQALVSRGKARPVLPRGPVPEQRALRLCADTCDECWDHDAEARLTAVCVEERMAELKQQIRNAGPVIHDNQLRSHGATAPIETDKNSNCIIQCDAHTPLLCSRPSIGRNPCLERNTLANVQTDRQLIHKSLKDIPDSTENRQNYENCLSVARNATSHVDVNTDMHDVIRDVKPAQPLDYVHNDVSAIETEFRPKQSNLINDKPKWAIKTLIDKIRRKSTQAEVKLINGKNCNRKFNTVVVDKPLNVLNRPPSLDLTDTNAIYSYEAPCTLSPPNKTLSPHMLENDFDIDKVFTYKEIPNYEEQGNQIFAVIVPKPRTIDVSNYIELHTKNGSSESLNKSSVKASSFQSLYRAGNSESEDSTIKKRLSCDTKLTNNSADSSHIELHYVGQDPYSHPGYRGHDYDYRNNENEMRTYDCSSSSEEENLLLSTEGSKITMHAVPKSVDNPKKYQNEILKDASLGKIASIYPKNKYENFDNELSDPHDKENTIFSADNPVYLAAINGEIDVHDKLNYSDERNSRNRNGVMLRNINKINGHSNGFVRKEKKENDLVNSVARTENKVNRLINGECPQINGLANKNTKALSNKCDDLKMEYLALNGHSTENATPNGHLTVDASRINGHSSPQKTKLFAQKSNPEVDGKKSPKPNHLKIKRQRSLEQVSEIFSSAGDINLLNPANRVKTPGDLPISVRKARRERVLQKGRNDCNRLSLYDDRIMFGNSL